MVNLMMKVSHVLHEDTTLQLQLRLSSGIGQIFGVELVLRLVDVDVLAAK